VLLWFWRSRNKSCLWRHTPVVARILREIPSDRGRGWNIHFETKKQTQKRENWSSVHFSVRWNWILLLSADCRLSQLQKICESIRNWFQLIYPKLSWLLYCVLLPCAYDFETFYVSVSWLQFQLYPRVLQPYRIFYGYSVIIQKQFLRVFQLFVRELKHFYQNSWKNSRIIFISWKWFKTRNDFGKKFSYEGVEVEAAYIAQTIFSFIATWKAAFDCYGRCNSSCQQRFMRKKFFKNGISENISQKFHDQWKIR